MKCKAGSGWDREGGRERERGREGGGAEKNGTAQKQKAVYFKVIDAIFFMTSFLIQSAGPWQLISGNGLNKYH